MSDSQKKKAKNIVYLGQDLSYWKDLQNRFRKLYPDKELLFCDFFERSSKNIKNLLYTLSRTDVDILLVDYSVHADALLRLTLAMLKEVTTQKMTIISLVDHLNKDMIRKSLALGVRILMFKGIELSSTVHHAFRMAFPMETKPLDFATAKVRFSAIGTTLMNVGFVTAEYMHIETNFVYEIGQILSFKTNLFPDVSLTGFFKVIRSGTTNLYSNFQRWYDVEYIHRDEERLEKLQRRIVELEQRRSKEQDAFASIDLKKARATLEEFKRNEKNLEEENKRQIAEWMDQNQELSRPKRTRVLVVDREMTMLRESEKDLESYSFSVRLVTGMDDQCKLVEQIFPGILVWVLESSESGKKEKLNSLEVLKKVIDKIRAFDKYLPYVFIFNNHEDEDSVHKFLDYKRILFSNSLPDLKTINALAVSYESKFARKKTHNPEFHKGDNEKRFYLSKYDAASITEYCIPIINVSSLSEYDIVFESSEIIPSYTTIYIKIPVKMALTVVPEKMGYATAKPMGVPNSKEKTYMYYALIHGLDEIGNTHLRKYIQTLFFEKTNAERVEESARFEALNKEVAARIKEEKRRGIRK